MWEGYSLFGVVVACVLIVLDFYLLRERKIEGRPFVFWFVVGVVLALFSAIPALVSLVFLLVGTEFLISAVVGVGFLFFILVFFYLDYRISQLRSQLMKLAMEVSVADFSKRQGNPGDSEQKKRKNRHE